MPSRLLYVSSVIVLAYCKGLYHPSSKRCHRIRSIPITVNAIVTVPCFLAVYREGRSEHSFGYAQWDSNPVGAIFPLAATALADVTDMGLCRVLSMVGFYPVLSLLAIRCTTKIAWEAGTLLDPQFFTYEFSTGSAFSLAAHCCRERHHNGSEKMVKVTARDIVLRQDFEFARLENCDAEWFEYRHSVSGSGTGPAVSPIEVLNMLDVDLLFERDAG